MKRAYANRVKSRKRIGQKRRTQAKAAAREIQLPLDRDDLLNLMQDSLETLATELGLMVALGLMEEKVTRLCGRRYERQPERVHTRYGHQQGIATLAGQKVSITRPRVRQAAGGGEVPLEMHARLQSPDAMPSAVLRRMVRGVSTREYEQVIDMARDGFGVAKSSVSRDFVRASLAQVKALAERRFDGQRFPVVMIDGVEYAGETMVVAMGITQDGTKRILGLRQGATENAVVCTELLENLREQGLDTTQPTLLVLDGSKALHAAASRVWGHNAVIQRCQIHTIRRNPQSGSSEFDPVGNWPRKGITWRISNVSSPTITRSISNCNIACFSSKLAPFRRLRIRSQKVLRSLKTFWAWADSRANLSCCSYCSDSTTRRSASRRRR